MVREQDLWQHQGRLGPVSPFLPRVRCAGLDYYTVITHLPKHGRPRDREAVVALEAVPDSSVVLPFVGVAARQQLRFLLFESRGAACVLSFVPLGLNQCDV